jgi:benzil reductase ((S)-benzoin forming)
MSEFIRLTENVYPDRRIINISSGAARHPYSGWVMYCASKAALDMMTLCVAAEQKDREYPVAVCSVSPGKVETGMQRSIRRFDKTKFPRQPDFVGAKLRGELKSTNQVADMILDLDHSGELKNGGIYDLRDIIFKGRRCSIQPINSLSGESS